MEGNQTQQGRKEAGAMKSDWTGGRCDGLGGEKKM